MYITQGANGYFSAPFSLRFVTEASLGVYAVETMSNGQKKVVVRFRDGAMDMGFLPATGFAREGWIEFMQVEGRAKVLGLNHVQWIAYVRDFDLENPADAEQLGRRTFTSRPRGDGLWLRLFFPNGVVLDGLAAVEAEFLDGLAFDGGLFLTPPDGRSNTQRMFIPRTAIARLEVMGLVTSPSRRNKATKDAPEVQGGLFEG